jgi:Plasmid replication region DNA-binding N-term
MPITQDMIWQAADQLVEAGQNPTLAAVRKAIGGGSFTTIGEALTTWKAAILTRQRALLQDPLPSALADRFTGLNIDLWHTAVALATSRLAADREALSVREAEADAARAEAISLADQLAAEMEKARDHMATLEAERIDLAERLTAAQIDAAGLRHGLAQAEARATAAEALAGRIDRLLTHLTTATPANGAGKAAPREAAQ